jgi:hypothetical protein
MTERRRFFILAGLTAALAAAPAAQAWSWGWGSGESVRGNGEAGSEVRDTGSFDAVALSGGFKVLIRQGTTTKVEIAADKNLLPYIETRIADGAKGRTLQVGPKKGFSINTNINPTITIDMPALRAVAVAGSGTIDIQPMKTASVDAAISGSGDIRFSGLDADHLGMRISGSGDIVAAGKATQVSITIAGAGDVKATELAADEVKVSIAGSGDALVRADKKLNVSIAGSGDVRYVGSPETTSSVAGSGSVRKLNK